MAEWIDRQAALDILGVRPQTLYAYVSRRRIGMRPDPADPRRSLYRADDVAALTVRRARGRRPAAIAASAIAWGEPSIPTAISTVHHGRLVYRGTDIAELVEAAALEDVARLLWQQEQRPSFAHLLSRGAGTTSNDVFVSVARLVGESRPSIGRSAARLHADAAEAIARIAVALGADPGQTAVHDRWARHWNLGADGADLVRCALILFAEHELNASTFAVRVAASTGASIAASLLAGLAALTGPRHGGAGEAAIAFMEDAERSGTETAIARWLERDRPLPGFGHPLYPEGDPRAKALLARLKLDARARELAQAVAESTGALPNIDFALAVMTRQLPVPRDTPFRLFAIGRSVGWSAHAIEQIASGQLIRPRAVYEGVMASASPP
jgi:citrate synthase